MPPVSSLQSERNKAMKTRFLPLFVVVAALALLAGFPQSGGAMPLPRESGPPVIAAQELPCPPGEPCDSAASRAPWKQSSDGHRFIAAGARSLSKAASAAPQATGGPDEYGYTWNDSWRSRGLMQLTGTDTRMSGSGSQAVGVSLPFSFKYYENTFNSVYIVGAGYLGFSSSSWYSQRHIPSPTTTQQRDRALLDSHYLNSAGQPGACIIRAVAASRIATLWSSGTMSKADRLQTRSAAMTPTASRSSCTRTVTSFSSINNDL